jgi:hypothetical protein
VQLAISDAVGPARGVPPGVVVADSAGAKTADDLLERYKSGKATSFTRR